MRSKLNHISIQMDSPSLWRGEYGRNRISLGIEEIISITSL